MTLKTWIGPTGGEFLKPANWDVGSVPTASDNARILGTPNSGLTVFFSGGAPGSVVNRLVMRNATLDVTSGSLTLSAPSTLSSVIENGGLLDFRNGGSADAVSAITGSVNQPLGNNAGTIEVDAGTLALSGGGTFGGTLIGPGTLALNGAVAGGTVYTLEHAANFGTGATAIAVAVGATATVAVAGTVSIAGGFDQAAGSLLSLGASMLLLSGNDVLAGTVLASAGGRVVASGTAAVAGLALTGAAVLEAKGSVNQAGHVGLGAGTQLTIDATGTYAITADQVSLDGLGAIANAGLFEKTLGSGIDTIAATFTNATTGTVMVNSGTLYFTGADSLGGTIGGAGTVMLGGGHQNSLLAGVLLSAATLDLVDTGTALALAGAASITGTFDQLAGTSIVLGANTLTLAAGSSTTTSGTITGATVGARVGTVLAQGALQLGSPVQAGGFVLGGTATLENQGSITQQFQATLGNGHGATLLKNDAHATYDLVYDAFGQGNLLSDGSASIVNDGLFEKTLGSGTNDIAARFTADAGGTIEVDTGTLYFTGGGAIGGTLDGTGTVLLGGGTGIAWTLGDAPVLAVGKLALVDNGTVLTLTGAVPDAGVLATSLGTTLRLGGQTLTLGGSDTLRGVVTGAGTLDVAAGASLVTDAGVFGGAALLDIQGVAAQAASNVLGDGATSTARLLVDTTGTYDFTGDAEMFRNGNTTVTNAGTLEKTGGTGISQIDPTVLNAASGIVAVTSGTLALAATVTNDGAINANLGATVAFAGALTDDSGMHGSVTVATSGTASFGGYVDAGQTIGFADTTGVVGITTPSLFHGTFVGFTTGDSIDLAGVGLLTPQSFSAGVLTLGGGGQTVRLNFAGSYVLGSFVTASDNHGGTLLTDPPAGHAALAAPSHPLG